MIILLFDGDCYLCQNSVQFVCRHDMKKVVHFAPLQSDSGKRLLKEQGMNEVPNSLVLLDHDRVFIKSEAILQLLKYFNWKWRVFILFKLVPRFLRDTAYGWVARHRYKWFGKANTCLLPTEELQSRLLD